MLLRRNRKNKKKIEKKHALRHLYSVENMKERNSTTTIETENKKKKIKENKNMKAKQNQESMEKNKKTKKKKERKEKQFQSRTQHNVNKSFRNSPLFCNLQFTN